MPPFQPKACVPVPAPTLPSATGPLTALLSAAYTSRLRTGSTHMLFTRESLVSPTTGFSVCSPMPGCSYIQSFSALAALQTHSVQVRSIGVSISPNSRTCVSPINLP